MALSVAANLALQPGSAGNNQAQLGIAVYRDGVLQPITTFDGTNGSSHLVADLVDEASPSELCQFLDSDLSQGTASEAAHHFWAAKGISGVPGAQVVALVIDLEWNDGVNPVETLTTTLFFSARFR